MNKNLNTQFGTARINHNGYYDICSRKENNKHKLLHVLIWESFYKTTLPKNCIIHHKNGNKLDNCILNLQLLTHKEHLRLHNTGEQNPMYGVPHKEESMISMSKSKSSTGYFRVYKETNQKSKQGFRWVYSYLKDGKRKKISSVSFDKLKEKVKERGLLWKKLT